MKEKSTQVICTIGPASQNLVKELEKAGMDVARINTAYTQEIDVNFENLMIDVRHWKVLQTLHIPKKSTVAVSFVKGVDCLKGAREYVSNSICAKIETREALKNLEEIVKESDYVMIARGDLGKVFGIHMIPLLQKKIISVCKKYEKPFIIATEVLKSMVHNPEPTRAEAIDVFHAVEEGAWGIMLAEETAIGKYPIEAVKWLNKIIQACENGKI